MTGNRKNANRLRRRSIRLPGYDYSQAGAYFVTVCTYNRACLLGDVAQDRFCPAEPGLIANACWEALPAHYPNVSLDTFVVMPNHIHGLLILKDQESDRTPLSEIVRGYKTWSARTINQYRKRSGSPVWQRGYHEHIVRNEASLTDIRDYIATNPLRWALDRENPAARAGCKPAPTPVGDYPPVGDYWAPLFGTGTGR